MTVPRIEARVLASLRRQALWTVTASGTGLAAGLAALPLAGTLPAAVGLGLFALVAAVMFDQLPSAHPHGSFGLGNGITVLRAAAACAFAALAVDPSPLDGAAGWGAAAGVVMLLALDGVDGLAARRQGLASPFGARFDMETDALLLLALATLAFGLGKVGAWVLGIGLLRYAFVAAGWVLPALRRPLPPSLRRKAVCVLQVGALALLLAPPVAPPLSGALAAAALAALVGSFASDTAWLLRGDR